MNVIKNLCFSGVDGVKGPATSEWVSSKGVRFSLDLELEGCDLLFKLEMSHAVQSNTDKDDSSSFASARSALFCSTDSNACLVSNSSRSMTCVSRLTFSRDSLECFSSESLRAANALRFAMRCINNSFSSRIASCFVVSCSRMLFAPM